MYLESIDHNLYLCFYLNHTWFISPRAVFLIVPNFTLASIQSQETTAFRLDYYRLIAFIQFSKNYPLEITLKSLDILGLSMKCLY